MKKLIFLAALFALTFSSNAADVDIYSKLKLGAWWIKTERFYDDSVGLIYDTNTTNNTIDTSIEYADDSLSPIYDNPWYPAGYAGFKFKSNNFEGCVEFGILYSLYNVELHGNTTTRYILQNRRYSFLINKWYAAWHINDIFSLQFGQDYTPVNFSQSNKALWYELEYANIGCLYTGPRPMFQVSLHDRNSIFEFKLAALRTDTTLFLDNKFEYVLTGETKIPKIETSVGFNIDNDFFAFDGKIAGGFQQYSNVSFNPHLAADSVRTKVNCFIVGADIGISLGAFTLICDVFYGQNIGSYGVLVGDPFGWHKLDPYMQVYFPKDTQATFDSEWKIYNSKVTEILGVLKVKPLDWFSFEGGYGIALGNHGFKPLNELWDPTHSWYSQCVLKPFDQISFIPEAGQYIYGSTIGFGRKTYWGLLMGVEF
jgi:hypothetical protein